MGFEIGQNKGFKGYTKAAEAFELFRYSINRPFTVEKQVFQSHQKTFALFKAYDYAHASKAFEGLKTAKIEFNRL